MSDRITSHLKVQVCENLHQKQSLAPIRLKFHLMYKVLWFCIKVCIHTYGFRIIYHNIQ